MTRVSSKKQAGKFCLWVLFLGLGMSSVWAEDISVQATVSSPKVALNESVQLTVTVSGAKDAVDPINIPDIDGFTTQYLGPSTSISVVNGDYHSERSFNYSLFPNKMGHYQIPAITANIAGKPYVTLPIDIDVVNASSSSSGANGEQAGSGGQNVTAESLKDKIFIQVSVDKSEAYVNERIPLRIKLLVDNVPVRDIQFPKFDKQGFKTDDFLKPEEHAQVINGVQYETIDFLTFIYPQQEGVLKVGPVEIDGNLLYKRSQNNPFEQHRNAFTDEFLKDLFNTYEARPITVTSQPIEIHVKPLPSDHLPADFSGAIGQFGFQAQVSPNEVKVGDPLTLKMTIRGNGSFKNLQMPVFKNDQFKTYDPQIKDGVNERSLEQVIIPVSDKVKEIPPITFSYFDPVAKEYKTLTQGPFSIHVLSPGPEQEFKAVGFSDMSHDLPENNKIKGKNISFEKIRGQLQSHFLLLIKNIWFWLLMAAVVVAGSIVYFWQKFQQRLVSDAAFSRRWRADREAKEGLAQAREYLLKNNNPKVYYALLIKVLRDYLANKWHKSSASLSVDDILSQLRDSKIDEKHLESVKALFEVSDLVCFAGASRDTAQMQQDLNQTQGLIAYFEKHLK